MQFLKFPYKLPNIPLILISNFHKTGRMMYTQLIHQLTFLLYNLCIL